MASLKTIYGIPFFAGFASYISPCIIPMITVYLSLITGISAERLLQMGTLTRLRKGILINTLFFILGFTIVFTLAGGAAGFIGKVLQKYLRVMEIIGGIFVILFGLHLAGIFKLNFIQKVKFFPKWNVERKPVGIFGALLVGFFFALVCSHCIGPMLYSTLIYSGILATPKLGAISMLSFSLGLAIPYILTAVFLTFTLDKLKKGRRILSTLNIVSGILLVLFGGLMLGRKFTQLSSFLSNLLPYKLPVGM